MATSSDKPVLAFPFHVSDARVLFNSGFKLYRSTSKATDENYSVEAADSRKLFRAFLDASLLRIIPVNRIFGALKIHGDLKRLPMIEPARIHNRAEENKDALKKFSGEEDEDFRILKYWIQKGKAATMCKIDIFYYIGLRGVRRDYLRHFCGYRSLYTRVNKTVDKGEQGSSWLFKRATGANKDIPYLTRFAAVSLAIEAADGHMERKDMVVASAATFVMAQCIDAIETTGAKHEHLI
ncbi:Sel1-like protein [Artemisia annua]|uniref:Sel1-like protein n=1 Tax=Artemisia annua TaxID=35608 RepID=A0A2U1KYT9_ARTAN|nr:Sel1-like protein [Artemisia annua]